MATVTKGDIRDYYTDGVAIQPDYVITEKNDGSIEGNVIFECDIADFANLPQMGAAHPSDSRCELYNREIKFGRLGKVTMTGSYFGIVESPTASILSYAPNVDKEPVETHPSFGTFAGTKAVPINGAKFDDDTGEFLGFFDPAIIELFGVSHYLVPATIVSLTYWSLSPPSLSRRMSIVSSVDGFTKPDDVTDFLLTDMPYRQVGTFYQITEQYLGSGINGWSEILYGD